MAIKNGGQPTGRAVESQWVMPPWRLAARGPFESTRVVKSGRREETSRPVEITGGREF